MEGGRSRTGKLRPPKYGLLRYLVDAIESGVADDMLLVPVSMTYDQLHEIGTLAAEEAGAQKAKEGLRWLADSGVVLRFAGGIEAVYGINPGQHSVAAFYRNSAIHWFVNREITELAWFMELGTGAADPLPQAWQRGFALRDLLKFDFFFSERETFSEEIKAERRLLDPRFRARAADPQTRRETPLQAPFLVAHRALTAFLEAYYIVAERLTAQPADALIDKAGFVAECVNVGRQYLMQRRLRNPECVSKELFGNAWQLAANRKLVKPGEAGLAARRAAFAAELAELVAAVGAIDELDRQRLPLRFGAAA